MMTELLPGLYRIEIPLPKNPLKALNAYAVVGEGRHLVVDTGFNTEDSQRAWLDASQAIGLDFAKTDLVLTHLHSDHTGLASWFAQKGARLFASPVDGDLINKMTEESYWRRFGGLTTAFDLDRDEVSIDRHPGYRYCPKEPMEITPLTEGERRSYGTFTFEVMDLPGHTPGHIGLYDPVHELLIGGDSILASITPNISYWSEDFDSLKVYFETLEKIEALAPAKILSSHRVILTEPKVRIDELRDHHAHRLNEVLALVSEGRQTARDVARGMHWDYRAKDWSAFPDPQKWFATSEAMSHLIYLVGTGKIAIDRSKPTWHFTRT